MSLELARQVLTWDAPQVVVIGDLMDDHDYEVVIERNAQESPAVPVMRHISHTRRPGGAGAVAAMLGSLGCAVRLFTGEPSYKARYYAGGRLVARYDLDCSPGAGGIIPAGKDPPMQDVKHAIAEAKAVVLCDHGKGAVFPQIAAGVIGWAQDANALCFVDPHSAADWSCYEGADVLKCTTAELSCRWKEGVHPQIVETAGEEGCRLPRSGRVLCGRSRRAVDPVGCGDAFLSALVCGVTAKMSLLDACVVANAAGGIEVERRGAVPIWREELITDLCYGTKVVDLPIASAICSAWRGQGHKVVVTNGCFDNLHAGHHSALSETVNHGTKCVVLVNDDASVRELKGPNRPFLPLAYRQQMLADLVAVDLVVGFSGRTPRHAIAQLRPDVLAKGRDYHGREIAGADLVTGWGGTVVLTDLLPGISTTGNAQ